jgi:hypothetical protein
MRAKDTFFILCTAFFLCGFVGVASADDWAYECGDDAKEIYTKKQIQIPCERINALLHEDDIDGVYIAIRDAALFGDKTCDKYIKQNIQKLKKIDAANCAMAFYSFKNGNTSNLKLLADLYDKRKVGDHWTVDLFGFLNEWEISGRRLVRHAIHSDASGSELLCSAIIWRRYLYGEKDFKYFWFKIGKEEKVSMERLQHFYDDCHP